MQRSGPCASQAISSPEVTRDVLSKSAPATTSERIRLVRPVGGIWSSITSLRHGHAYVVVKILAPSSEAYLYKMAFAWVAQPILARLTDHFRYSQALFFARQFRHKKEVGVYSSILTNQSFM